MTPYSDGLINIRKHSGTVMLGNWKTVPIQAIGDVRVFVKKKGIISETMLRDVPLVPGLTKHLLSVSQLTRRGFEFIFSNNSCTLKSPAGNVSTTGNNETGLYKLDICTAGSHEALLTISSKGASLEVWHARLGHLHYRKIKELHSKNVVNGLVLGNSQLRAEQECNSCVLGKMARQPFPASENSASRALELIHSDVCGPLPVKSSSGKRYFVTFIDDYSKYTHVYLMANKSEVTAKFKEFMHLAERETGKRIGILRSDGGGEYMNNAMRELCTNSGIRQEFSTPYRKVENKAKRGIIVGYAQQQKGYRIYDLEKKTLIVSRDVICDEQLRYSNLMNPGKSSTVSLEQRAMVQITEQGENTQES
jgi:hypothetical protein